MSSRTPAQRRWYASGWASAGSIPQSKFVHVWDADWAQHSGTRAAELDKLLQYSGHD